MGAKPKEAFEKLQEGIRPVQQIYAENRQRDSKVNMSEPERWMSSISGGALAVYGLTKGGWGGFSLAALGGLNRGRSRG